MKKVFLGFVLGVGFASFLLFGFLHHASFCSKGGDQSSQQQPADSHADAANKSSQDGHIEPSGHARKPARFGCGIEGVGPAFVHMMDSHEGFFMGSFTLLLVVVTGWLVYTTSGLRQSTDKLWEAGERQIELARETAAAQSRDMQASIKIGEDAAIAAAKSADAALNLHRPWVRVELESTTATLEDAGLNFRAAFTIRMVNVGTTPATHAHLSLGMGAGISRFDRARERLLTGMPHGRTLFPNDEPSNRVIYAHVPKKEVFDETWRIDNPDGSVSAFMGVVVAAEYEFPGGKGATSKAYALFTSRDPNSVCIDSVPVQVHAREIEDIGTAT